MQIYLCLSSESAGRMKNILISHLFYFSFTPTLITLLCFADVQRISEKECKLPFRQNQEDDKKGSSNLDVLAKNPVCKVH
jgi:hypothetical protein